MSAQPRYSLHRTLCLYSKNGALSIQSNYSLHKATLTVQSRYGLHVLLISINYISCTTSLKLTIYHLALHNATLSVPNLKVVYAFRLKISTEYLLIQYVFLCY